MAWIDFALILFFIVSLGVGARLGSLWIGACMAGGFLGAFLVDMYAPVCAAMMGRFPGADGVAVVALFIAGGLIALIPGLLLSRISAGLFLGVIDSAFGLVVGAVAGLCAITLILLVLLPMAPKIEKSGTWKKSILVRPLQQTLEDALSTPHFHNPSRFKLIPVAREAQSEIKDAASRIVHQIKK